MPPPLTAHCTGLPTAAGEFELDGDEYDHGGGHHNRALARVSIGDLYLRRLLDRALRDPQIVRRLNAREFEDFWERRSTRAVTAAA